MSDPAVCAHAQALYEDSSLALARGIYISYLIGDHDTIARNLADLRSRL